MSQILTNVVTHGMAIEYLKCRTDLNFKVDGAIGTIVTKWDLFLFG